MRVFISLIVTLLCVGSPPPQRCRCSPAASDETTRPGANEHIVQSEERKYARIAGIVRAENDEILSDVLVEVFDQPGHLLLPFPERFQKAKRQHRIAACIVQNNGRFCFSGVPPGQYEVRFSKNIGWKHTSIVVSVAPRDRSATKQELEVTMRLGT